MCKRRLACNSRQSRSTRKRRTVFRVIIRHLLIRNNSIFNRHIRQCHTTLDRLFRYQRQVCHVTRTFTRLYRGNLTNRSNNITLISRSRHQRAMSNRRAPRYLNVTLRTVHTKSRGGHMVGRTRRPFNFNYRIRIPQHVRRNRSRITIFGRHLIHRSHSTSHLLRKVNIRGHVTIVRSPRFTSLANTMRRHLKRHNLTHIRVHRSTYRCLFRRLYSLPSTPHGYQPPGRCVQRGPKKGGYAIEPNYQCGGSPGAS